MFNLAEELAPMRAGRALILMGASALVVFAVITGYIFWNRVPPTAEGRLLGVRAYKAHLAETDSAAAHPDNRQVVLASETQKDSPLIVLTPVRISNVGEKPLTLSDMSAVMSLGDTEYRSLDVSSDDFSRVFQFYPDVTLPRGLQPILRHAVIQPGETVKGLLVFNYPLSLEQWSQRRSFDVTVTFDHNKDLVLADPAADAASSSGS